MMTMMMIVMMSIISCSGENSYILRIVNRCSGCNIGKYFNCIHDLFSSRAEYDIFQIELAKNYGIPEWKEDIKKILMKAGVENKSVVFLFSDTQIKSETFLEDLNNILNAGDVPNLFAMDELDAIYTALKPVVQDEGLQPTKVNLYSAFTRRVKANTHSVICMR